MGEVVILLNLLLHAAAIIRRDVTDRIIPNNFLLSLVFIHLIISTVMKGWTSLNYFQDNVLIAATVFTFYFLVSIFSQGKFGMGDAKAMTATSVVVGFFSWQLVLLHLIVTHLMGLVIGLTMLVQKKRGTIAFAIPIFLSSLFLSGMTIFGA